MQSPVESARRIVIKLGSALIVDAETGMPRSDWLCTLAQDVARLKADGRQVVIVSSGAAALGRSLSTQTTQRLLRGGALELKQAAAAIGQPRLMTALANAFFTCDIHLAQALLTLEDTEIRRRWLNARATLFTLLDLDVVPVINENDTVATSELRYGDNDRLAARVAQMIGADLLILLSDIDGLYTADPRKFPDARYIDIVNAVTPDIRACAGDANLHSGVGTGGMTTKLDAAEIAWQAGCSTLITLGKPDHPIERLLNGGRATLIRSDVSPQTARSTWLSGHLTPEGAVIVDGGAAKALLSGASLLPVGVKSTQGDFKRGAPIAIQTRDGHIIAKGVSAYSAAEINLVKGLQSGAVSEKLGYPARTAIIHRDDMVLTPNSSEANTP